MLIDVKTMQIANSIVMIFFIGCALSISAGLGQGLSCLDLDIIMPGRYRSGAEGIMDCNKAGGYNFFSEIKTYLNDQYTTAVRKRFEMERGLPSVKCYFANTKKIDGSNLRTAVCDKYIGPWNKRKYMLCEAEDETNPDAVTCKDNKWFKKELESKVMFHGYRFTVRLSQFNNGSDLKDSLQILDEDNNVLLQGFERGQFALGGNVDLWALYLDMSSADWPDFTSLGSLILNQLPELDASVVSPDKGHPYICLSSDKS